jgi:glycosyltransferase involved in cell wall biosynthesis
MLSGRDVIIISSIEWDFNWQGHQEIARRLAERGNRVLYIENMGVRTPDLGDARRIAVRASNWIRSLPSGGVREVLPNVHVCSPLILPPFGSPARQFINRRALLPLIRRAVRKLGFKSEIILAYLPTDTAASLIQLLRKPTGLTVYYCIADFAELTPLAGAIKESERAIIEMSDIVFAQCEELAKRCAHGHKQVSVFPFGVNLDLFSPGNDCSNLRPDGLNGGRDRSGPEITLLPALRRPIIGYVGGIHRHFDVELLTTMAREKPDWSWVLIGPLQSPLRGMKHMPNIHLLGPQTHQKLPNYIRDFDVGIVPYLHNEYTMTVVPTKINEYLAMGKPVVSTDLPEVKAFNDEYDVLITSSNYPTEFLSSIEKALRLSGGDAITAYRRKVAALSSWDERIEQMSKLIERKLQSRQTSSVASSAS